MVPNVLAATLAVLLCMSGRPVVADVSALTLPLNDASQVGRAM
jgi:hypothetical protein